MNRKASDVWGWLEAGDLATVAIALATGKIEYDELVESEGPDWNESCALEASELLDSLVDHVTENWTPRNNRKVHYFEGALGGTQAAQEIRRRLELRIDSRMAYLKKTYPKVYGGKEVVA